MPILLPRRPRRRADDGFTLVETVVALLVAAVVFMGLTGALLSALKASAFGRQNQQAADFMTRGLEDARNASFGSLGHLFSDVQVGAADPRISTCSGGTCIDLDTCTRPGTGVPRLERLHLVPGPAIAAHVKNVTGALGNNAKFRVSTYITEVAGGNPAQTLRATVFVSWGAPAKPHLQCTSSLIALAQRGLPTPVFTFLPSGSTTATKAPGATVTHVLKLTNQGAPDRWNLTLSGAGASRPWKLYRDADGDAAFTSAVDTALVSTDGDSVVDTGRLDPNSTAVLLLVYESSPTSPTGTVTTDVRATSVTDSTVFKTVSITTTLSTSAPSPSPAPTSTSPPPNTAPADAPACPWSGSPPAVSYPAAANHGYSAQALVLHNGPGGGASTTQPSSSMSAVGVYSTTLYPYSSEVAADSGRAVAPAGSSTTASALLGLNDVKLYSDWLLPLGERTDVAGTAVLRLWIAASPSGSVDRYSLPVSVFTKSGTASPVNLGFATVTGRSACTGYQEVYVQVPLTTSTLAKNDVLGLRVGNSGAARVRLGYDATSYPAALHVAVR